MPIPNPWPKDVKIPWNLFLKIALFITTAILGPGDTAPSRHTIIILIKIIKDLINKALDVEAELITLPECATSLQKNSIITKELAKTEDENFSLQTLKEITIPKLKRYTSSKREK